MIHEGKQAVAVALEYDNETAPRVSATGFGKIAEQIIEIAYENGVYLAYANWAGAAGEAGARPLDGSGRSGGDAADRSV